MNFINKTNNNLVIYEKSTNRTLAYFSPRAVIALDAEISNHPEIQATVASGHIAVYEGPLPEPVKPKVLVTPSKPGIDSMMFIADTDSGNRSMENEIGTIIKPAPENKISGATEVPITDLIKDASATAVKTAADLVAEVEAERKAKIDAQVTKKKESYYKKKKLEKIANAPESLKTFLLKPFKEQKGEIAKSTDTSFLKEIADLDEKSSQLAKKRLEDLA